jgi:nitronate monooxygenase
MTEAVSTDLPSITIRGRKALPVVQGGMGVGVSAHRLAGSVAARACRSTCRTSPPRTPASP